MKRTRVKFCGMMRAEDAAAAAELGADAIGVVFATSPRQVSIEQAAAICQAAGAFVTRVGVFAGQDASFIAEAVAACRLDWVQLAGAVDDDAIAELRAHARVVRTVHFSGTGDITAAAAGLADAYLLDAPPVGEVMGGNGRPFDWGAVEFLPWPRERVVVAGGLTAENVDAAIRRFRPGAVDVSSGIERGIGIKDGARMRAFLAAVRLADGMLPRAAPRAT